MSSKTKNYLTESDKVRKLRKIRAERIAVEKRKEKTNDRGQLKKRAKLYPEQFV